MGKAAFLATNLQAGITPTGSPTAAGLPWSKLTDPQPRHRARVAQTAFSAYFDLGAAKTVDCAALISTTLSAAAVVLLRASTSQPFPSHNLLLQSNDFTQSNWVKSESIVSATGQGDYQGGSTATLLDESTNNAQHDIHQAVSGIPDGTVVSVSFKVKPNERNWCRVALVDKASTTTFANVNTTTGAVGTNNAGAGGIVVTSVGNSYYEIVLTANVATGGGTPTAYFIIMNGDNASTVYTGTAGNGMFVSHAMLDYGATIGNTVVTTSSQFSPTFSAGIQNGPTDPSYNGNVIATFAQQTLRYWRWDAWNTTNPIDIGLAPMGLLIRPGRNFNYGAQEGVIDLGQRDRNPDTGAEFGLSGPKPRAKLLTFSGLTKAEIRDTFGGVDRSVGGSGDLLFVEDPDASYLDRARDSIWGAYRQLGADFASRQGAQVWSRAFRLTERL